MCPPPLLQGFRFETRVTRGRGDKGGSSTLGSFADDEFLPGAFVGSGIRKENGGGDKTERVGGGGVDMDDPTFAPLCERSREDPLPPLVTPGHARGWGGGRIVFVINIIRGAYPRVSTGWSQTPTPLLSAIFGGRGAMERGIRK